MEQKYLVADGVLVRAKVKINFFQFIFKIINIRAFIFEVSYNPKLIEALVYRFEVDGTRLQEIYSLEGQEEEKNEKINLEHK